MEKKDSEVRPSDRPDGRDAERVFKNSWCWFYFQPFQDMSIENKVTPLLTPVLHLTM